MLQEPPGHGHRVRDVNEVAPLLARRPAMARAEESDRAAAAARRMETERHAGHRALVRLSGTVDVEVAEAHHLAGRGAEERPHALVEEPFRARVAAEGRLVRGRLDEPRTVAVHGGRGSIEKRNAAGERPREQPLGILHVVPEEVVLVLLRRVGAGAEMHDRFDIAGRPRSADSRRVTNSSLSSASRMPCGTRPSADARRSSSTTITAGPRATRSATRLPPIKPAPPVTTITGDDLARPPADRRRRSARPRDCDARAPLTGIALGRTEACATGPYDSPARSTCLRPPASPRPKRYRRRGARKTSASNRAAIWSHDHPCWSRSAASCCARQSPSSVSRRSRGGRRPRRRPRRTR